MTTESIKTQGFQIPSITLELCALVPSWQKTMILKAVH